MEKIMISEKKCVAFNNQMDYCVGTGRMGLALHKEYYEQLKMVQEEIGFRYIRGHGLFCRDMAIYQQQKLDDGTVLEEYNFTYLDRVLDMYLQLHIRPFLELGFMPEEMASGEETTFYWKGNITPPTSYDKWIRLVQATLRHVIQRYGEEEVLQWPIEVWNEPNLAGFWKNADMQEYFHLYEVTAKAVKEVHSGLRVGGPAICGVDDERWMREFLDFVKMKHAPLDFITRHHYTSNMPDRVGHYGYIELHDPNEAQTMLENTRAIIDGYEEFRGMELHITEFNTSYIPNAPIHDTCYNAAYIARMLSELGDAHASYSYWTFGDVFEEFGVPFTPFHGGFGLVANGGIPKPTYWTFAFFKKLQGKCLYRSKKAVVVQTGSGSYYGVAWNPDDDGSKKELSFAIEIELPQNHAEHYSVLTKLVDEKHGNPLKIWHDLGEPANPSAEQVTLLKQCAVPHIGSSQVTAENGKLCVSFTLASDAVKSFEIKTVCGKSDNGYDYERVLAQRVAQEGR